MILKCTMDAIIKNTTWLNFNLICLHNWLSLFQLQYCGNNAPAHACALVCVFVCVCRHACAHKCVVIYKSCAVTMKWTTNYLTQRNSRELAYSAEHHTFGVYLPSMHWCITMVRNVTYRKGTLKKQNEHNYDYMLNYITK